MGVVPQLDNLDVDVTVEDNLAVFARLYRVRDVRAAVDFGLELARLDGRRRDAVDELSGGMRRRLLLARGLVHDPQLLLLDEPTVGLDPQIRTELWSLIDSLRTRGQDDPHVHALHRGGRAARRRGGRDGAREDHQPREAVRSGRAARRPGDRRGVRAARAARRGARAGGGAGAEGAPGRAGDRDRGLGEGHQRRGARRTRSAARRRSRTCSCCSRGRRRSEEAGAGRHRRRDEPRGGELPHVLEGHDLLERPRAGRVPAGVRPRPRRDAREPSRRPRATWSTWAPGWSPPR